MYREPVTKRVVVLGATGLVGRQLLQLLSADAAVSEVVVVARRPAGISSPKVRERIVDMSALEQHADAFAADDLFCALGTTIRQAGSQDAFRHVDYELPMTAARLALQQGVRHYLLVSALGADARSRIFYSRVKGELERDLIALQFPSLTIVRPSLLLGDRSERRRGEEIAKHFSWLMPPKYKGIQALTVARALVDSSNHPPSGVRILESRQMRERFERR